jgi:hypothetical protein
MVNSVSVTVTALAYVMTIARTVEDGEKGRSARPVSGFIQDDRA